ncbi:MAG: hypothetical protein LBM99_00425 [Bacillales bacterium]|jgi:hypothetical protein|nr:hypothetical protein [Bacillales bacterium]
MKKNLLKTVLMWLAPLVVMVAWLLKIIIPDSMTWFNVNLGVAFVAAVWGVLILLDGLFGRGFLSKKFNVTLGGVLITVAVIYTVLTFIDGSDKSWIAPIIGIAVVLFVFLLPIIAVGGKKYDTADNEKVGYKNYYERKKEEEKKNKGE